MSRYLYTTAGAVIGYFDQDDKYLYTQAGKVIAYLDDKRTYMYAQGGTVMVTSLKTASTFTQQLGLSSDMSNHLLTDQMKSIL
jgi:hypothetical protein